MKSNQTTATNGSSTSHDKEIRLLVFVFWGVAFFWISLSLLYLLLPLIIVVFF